MCVNVKIQNISADDSKRVETFTVGLRHAEIGRDEKARYFQFPSETVARCDLTLLLRQAPTLVIEWQLAHPKATFVDGPWLPFNLPLV